MCCPWIAEPIWGSPPFLLVSRLTPLRRPLRRGTPGLGFFMQNPVKTRGLAGREPPSPKRGGGDPQSKLPDPPGIKDSSKKPSLSRSIVSGFCCRIYVKMGGQTPHQYGRLTAWVGVLGRLSSAVSVFHVSSRNPHEIETFRHIKPANRPGQPPDPKQVTEAAA